MSQAYKNLVQRWIVSSNSETNKSIVKDIFTYLKNKKIDSLIYDANFGEAGEIVFYTDRLHKEQYLIAYPEQIIAITKSDNLIIINNLEDVKKLTDYGADKIVKLREDQLESLAIGRISSALVMLDGNVLPKGSIIHFVSVRFVSGTNRFITEDKYPHLNFEIVEVEVGTKFANNGIKNGFALYHLKRIEN